jgi:hypothetical protein
MDASRFLLSFPTALLLATGCGGGGSASTPGGDASVSDAGTDVRIGDAGADTGKRTPDAGTTDSGAPPGPCVEGMVCSGSTQRGSMTLFTCTCFNGRWACDKSPSDLSCGFGGGGYVLPTADPQPDAGCTGLDMACSLPDRCGELAVCTYGTWFFASALATLPEAGAPGDGGCPWRVCNGPVVQPDGTPTSCAPGDACFLANCGSAACVCPPSGGWSCSTAHATTCVCGEQM